MCLTVAVEVPVQFHHAGCCHGLSIGHASLNDGTPAHLGRGDELEILKQ
jgi:hypothetical protein